MTISLTRPALRLITKFADKRAFSIILNTLCWKHTNSDRNIATCYSYCSTLHHEANLKSLKSWDATVPRWLSRLKRIRARKKC